jgi:predicted ATPase/DNA-binding SARP family transcriptional activator
MGRRHASGCDGPRVSDATAPCSVCIGAATVPAHPPSPLNIRLFGPLEVRLDGHPIPRLRSRKGQWLLALLVLRAGREVERDWLAALLWPESPPDRAAHSLRMSLKDLRRALGPHACRLTTPAPHTLSLDLDGAEVDLLAFDAAVARGDAASLEQAVALYQGPLLEGCAEEWVVQERQVREQAFLAALEHLAGQALQEGDWAAAERHLRRAVAVDPLRESAQRGLMHALAAGGNYAAALLAYRELRLRLHRELNAEPDPETKALFQQIRAEARGKAEGRTGRPRDDAGWDVASSRPPVPPFADPGEFTISAPRIFPEGTVTFLFTDIEGSTRLWEEQPEAMQAALARHDALLRQAIEARAGWVFKTLGDQFCAAFATAPDALAAAVEAQRALAVDGGDGVSAPVIDGPAPAGSSRHPVTPSPIIRLRVRMALYTGAVEVRDSDYFGPPLNRVARLLDAAHGGQILLALSTAELVRDQLLADVALRDLGLYRLPDLVRPEQIFQLIAPDLPADFPPLQTLEVFRHNLPLQHSRFIGREQELAQVQRLLASHRLVTLTGAGGCGKTRMALQVAAELLAEYPDGVWLVELASLTDPTLLPQSVAAVLDIQEQPGRSMLATLTSALRSKRLLLLLDNCEHLVEACASLADSLLQGCPILQILATSREALSIKGEMPYRVPSLSTPDPERLPPLEQLASFDAVRLFLDRVLPHQPEFRLTEGNATAVARICQQLDGIPLAIELAAARMRALSVQTLAERLDDRFRLLTRGSRTALPRHQTLRALIDWSYQLLSEAEQGLLRRLSVFTGGWTLEAAEAVCADEDTEPWEVVDLLTGLVDKSLVLYQERDGAGRYRLLETVRQYAGDRLLEAGETAGMRRRHGAWYLRATEETRSPCEPLDVAWMDLLEQEHDNVRAALEWSQAGAEDAELAFRWAAALFEFWQVRGYWSEGRARLEAMVSRPDATGRTAARAEALWALGALTSYQGDYAAAQPVFEEALTIRRELSDQAGAALALASLGNIALRQGNHGAACSLFEESLAIRRKLGQRWWEAGCLYGLGLVAETEGDYTGARSHYEEADAIDREHGVRGGAAFRSLGELALKQGDIDAARRIFEEDLKIHQEFGNKAGISDALYNMGRLAYHQGSYEAALTSHQESVSLRQELGDRKGVAASLDAFAAVAVAQGRPEPAARLLGAATAQREFLGTPLSAAERADHDRAVSVAHAAMGEVAFAAAFQEGQAMSLHEAVEYTLQDPRD